MGDITPEKKGDIIRGLVFILLIIAVLLFIVKITFAGTIPIEKDNYSKQDALIESHIYIKKLLKFPDHTKFPTQPDETIEAINDSTFTVQSYVDYQHTLGPVIRMYYKCDITLLHDGMSNCENLVLE